MLSKEFKESSVLYARVCWEVLVLWNRLSNHCWASCKLNEEIEIGEAGEKENIGCFVGIVSGLDGGKGGWTSDTNTSDFYYIKYKK